MLGVNFAHNLALVAVRVDASSRDGAARYSSCTLMYRDGEHV
jgi:hypothetical protein